MRVSTRIISGTGILVVLALLALATITFILQMQTLNSNLVKVFRASQTAEDIVEDVGLIWDHSRRFFSTRTDYTKIVTDAHSKLDDDIADLKREINSSQRSSGELLKLESAWQEYRDKWNAAIAEWDLLKSTDKDIDNAQVETFNDLVITHIDPVFKQATILRNTVEDSFEEDAKRATAMGRNVRNLSVIVPAIAFALVIVSVFLWRTINDSLRQLTRGTRMIAQGQFWHRLPTSGKDEFAELANDFNSMSQRLGELDSMKKDFVSHVSHELKAPLASIRQTFHLVLEQIPGPLNDQQKRLLRLSYGSAERLAAMVGNLLDVSRMEAGSMEYSVAPTDLLQLARSVADEFEVQSRERGMSIRIDAPANGTFMVECDRDRMSQVIGNLFDNALKFSPRDSEIIVSLEMRDSEKERFTVFSVRDCGIGVPDEHKSRIFGKFHQVKQGKKMSGQGVGLGLAICGSIVEAHRGRIWVEDNPTGGSVFYFEVPSMVRMEATTA